MSLSEGLLKVKLNTTSDPSVAEAGEIVATVALLLSIIVPVAEAVPEQWKFRHFINVSQLLVPIPFQ
jgi:hypothetical protein